jgi:prephenate dehydrogenase
MRLFENISIIGVGLLGGSLAKACKKRGLVDRISGYGRNRKNLEAAMSQGVIDGFATDLPAAVKDADFVILCSPVGALVPLAREILPVVKSGCLLTDIGSVKGPVVRAINEMLPDTVRFVGSHPIAGGEQSGLEASTPDLYENAKCIVTPTDATDAAALNEIQAFWEAIGMKVVPMDMDEHDLIYGAVSHLPHVVAYALMNTIGETKTEHYDEILSFSGEGLKDCTRIAAGNPVMWRDICIDNKKPILKLIDQFQDTLGSLREWIESEDAEALQKSFEAANEYRLNLT